MAWFRSEIQEGRKGESDRIPQSLLVTYITHIKPATCHRPCLPQHLFQLTFLCRRHSRCLCSRGSSAASLVPLLKMGPALCLPAPGAAAGDRDRRVKEPAAPTVPGEPSAPGHQASPCRVWLPLSPPPQQEQYQGVGLAFTGVSRPTPAGCLAAAPLGPQQALTTGPGFGPVAEESPRVWFFESGELLQGWSQDQGRDPRVKRGLKAKRVPSFLRSVRGTGVVPPSAAESPQPSQQPAGVGKPMEQPTLSSLTLATAPYSQVILVDQPFGEEFLHALIHAALSPFPSCGRAGST